MKRPSDRHGPCAICGVTQKLTFEHIPPRAAFNDRPMLGGDVQHHIENLPNADPLKMRTIKLRKGAGDYTLCASCNNFTGGIYTNAYLHWAHQGMRFHLAGVGGFHLPFQIMPAKVAKQIVAMFASVCGPGLFNANPQLRKFVLDPHARGVPAHIRILCYLLSPNSTRVRQAGITGMINSRLDGTRASSKTFAELAFPPFGYLLTFEAPGDNWGLADITFFTHHAFGEYREMHLPMITKEVHTYFPGDFRTHSQWMNAVKRPKPAEDLHSEDDAS